MTFSRPFFGRFFWGVEAERPTGVSAGHCQRPAVAFGNDKSSFRQLPLVELTLIPFPTLLECILIKIISSTCPHVSLTKTLKNELQID